MAELAKHDFLTVHQVTARLQLSRATVWRLENQGLFPPRRQITPGRVGWLVSDIDAWVAERPLTKAGSYRGGSDD